MPKTKKQKEEVIRELEQFLKDQKLMAFFTFRGLKMDDFNKLRNEVKEKNSLIKVAKKTLFKLALGRKGVEVPEDYFSIKDQFAILFGFSDDPGVLKVLDKVSKEKEGVKIIGGFFEGKVLSGQEVVELSRIPSRKELITKFVWLLSYPKQSLVNILEGNIRDLILVLSAKAKKGQIS